MFGGTTNRPLNVAFRLGTPAIVGIKLLRRGRTVVQFAPTACLAHTNSKARLATGRGLQRGDYVVEITVTRGSSAKRYRLLARRL